MFNGCTECFDVTNHGIYFHTVLRSFVTCGFIELSFLCPSWEHCILHPNYRSNCPQPQQRIRRKKLCLISDFFSVIKRTEITLSLCKYKTSSTSRQKAEVIISYNKTHSQALAINTLGLLRTIEGFVKMPDNHAKHNRCVPKWINESFFQKILTKNMPHFGKIQKLVLIPATPSNDRSNTIMLRVRLEIELDGK